MTSAMLRRFINCPIIIIFIIIYGNFFIWKNLVEEFLDRIILIYVDKESLIIIVTKKLIFTTHNLQKLVGIGFELNKYLLRQLSLWNYLHAF